MTFGNVRTRHLSNYWKTKGTVYPSNIVKLFQWLFSSLVPLFRYVYLHLLCIENENHAPRSVRLTAKSLTVCHCLRAILFAVPSMALLYYISVRFSFSHFKHYGFHLLFINCFTPWMWIHVIRLIQNILVMNSEERLFLCTFRAFSTAYQGVLNNHHIRILTQDAKWLSSFVNDVMSRTKTYLRKNNH